MMEKYNDKNKEDWKKRNKIKKYITHIIINDNYLFNVMDIIEE